VQQACEARHGVRQPNAAGSVLQAQARLQPSRGNSHCDTDLQEHHGVQTDGADASSESLSELLVTSAIVMGWGSKVQSQQPWCQNAALSASYTQT